MTAPSLSPRGEATPSAEIAEAMRLCLKTVDECYEATGHVRVGPPSRERLAIERGIEAVSALLASAEAGRVAAIRADTLEALYLEAGRASPSARFLVIDRRRIDRAIAEALEASRAPSGYVVGIDPATRGADITVRSETPR